MQDQAWPFLVSRNKVLGYHTFVSPGFLIDKGAADSLACAVEAEFDDAESDEPICTQLPETSAGPLTLFYRVSRATEGGRVLRDSAGRPVLRFDGVVMRGQKGLDAVPGHWLDAAKRAVEPSFKRFWKSRERIGPVRSDGVIVEEVPAGRPRPVTGANGEHDRPAEPTTPVNVLERFGSTVLRMVRSLRARTSGTRLFAAFFAGVILGGGLVYLASDGSAHGDGKPVNPGAQTEAVKTVELVKLPRLADGQGLYE